MPSRVFREGLLDSERIAALHDKTFRLYVSLLLTADDFGLVSIDYGAIKKANAMQEWSREMVAKMLVELTDADLILPYEFSGKHFAAIQRWQSRVNCVRPKFPEPTFGMSHQLRPYQFKSEHIRQSASLYFKHIEGDGVPPVGHQGANSGTKGVRGKGEGIKEKTKAVGDPSLEKTTARATRFALDTVPQDWVEFCKTERPDISPTATFDRFADYWRGVPGARGRKLDWPATWRNWVRNERAGRKESTPADVAALVEQLEREGR